MNVKIAFRLAGLICGVACSTLPAPGHAEVGSAADAASYREADLLIPLDSGGLFGDAAPRRASLFESSRLVRLNVLGLAANP